MKLLKAAAMAAALLSATATAQSADPTAPLAWLSGCWAADGQEPGSGEMWLPPAGGTMFGVSRTVKSGRTVQYEFMQIRENPEGKLVFIARPSGQQGAEFVQARLTEDEVTFENPAHDFPQRVSYRSTGPDTLVGRIESVRDGVLGGVDFPMRRSTCGPAR